MSENEKVATVIIYVDDSGKLTKKESVCTYGGLVFTSQKEKENFNRMYKSILNDIKHNYIQEEIKNINLISADRRRIINLCKKYKPFSIIINNNDVYENIINDKASKGRFIDFAQKKTFIDILKELMKEDYFDKFTKVNLTINIDQQTTKTNGYYSLRDGLYEELIHGIENFNYGYKTKPILNRELNLNIHYLDSKKNTVIQASDIIAGIVRKELINSSNFPDGLKNRISWLWLYRKFPQKK